MKTHPKSVIAAVVLCLTAHGQTSAPAAKGEGTSLDAARRDLRSLPATERSQDLFSKPSGVGSASLPALTLPGEGAASQNKPDPNAPPSANWLQDALKQVDAERSQRRAATDPSLGREQAHGYKPVPAPDLLGQYLGQWLTPRDLELLRPDIKKIDEQKNKNLLYQAQPATGIGLQGGPNSQPALGPAQILPMTRNPYLEDPGALPPAQLPNPFTSPAPAGLQQNDQVRAPSSLPAATSSQPRLGEPEKPALAPVQAPPLPPTAPIVDDRKYFPQLHRF